jgi:hypothetical protein
MLPRPWYERVQSIAGTPSMLGGASARPAVRERWERASMAADSADWLREVGIGGSLAGKEGTTVRWGVADDEDVDVDVEVAGLEMVFDGLDAVEEAVEGFAAVDDVVVAGLGAVAYAVRIVDEEKVRDVSREAMGAALGDEAERRAEKPLQAGVAAILCVQ